MKKKILAAIFVFVLLLTALSATVFAERKTEFPIKLWTKDIGATTYICIFDFDITEIKNIDKDSYKICFNIRHNGTTYHLWNIAFNCYDASGMPIKTTYSPLNKYATNTSGSVDVPIKTATIEIAIENPMQYSESYLYNDLFVTMYAYENGQFGRRIDIFPYQIEEYKKVGWYTQEEVNSAVRMYAYKNGRFDKSIFVLKNQVEEYRKVGWYTQEEVNSAVTLYAYENGYFRKRIKVVADQVEEYRKVGWYTQEEVNSAVTLYAYENGSFARSTTVPERLVTEYRKAGWYTKEEVDSSVTMFAYVDGDFPRSMQVLAAQVEEYRNVGWYTQEEVNAAETLYAKDDNGYFTRSIKVPQNQKSTYINLGWYTWEDAFMPKSFPITLIDSKGGALIIQSLTVTDVYEEDGKTKIKYTVDYTNNNYYDFEYEITLYDESGKECGSKITSTYKGRGRNTESWIITTVNPVAMLEFTSNSQYSQSYFHNKSVNIYASDGRVMAVHDLRVPAYEKVGWKGEVTMYAYENGGFTRSIKVKPYEEEAYRQVGWYTKEEVSKKQAFDGVVSKIENYKASKQYNDIFVLIDSSLPDYMGTRYEQPLYDYRTEAMDLWRNSSGAPLGVLDYSVSENSIGTPKVSINFRNISHKKILAFKVKFTCYDIFGDLEESYYNSFYIDSANLDVAKSRSYTWTLYGADSVHTVKNIRVTEVVFEDGTKWKI